MGSAALADFLPDFGVRPRPAAAPTSPLLAVAPQPAAPPDPMPPAVDLEAEISTAVAVAEADMAERMETLYEGRLAAQREAHETELRDLAASLGAEFGARLTGALAEAEQRLTAVATSAAARLLAQLATDEIAQRAVGELARTIGEAMADADAMRIRVRGPQSMFMALSVALGTRARQLDFVEAPGPDLSVSIDETLFETRISEWSRALDGVIG